MPIKEV